MKWPMSQEFNEAVQNPNVAFRDVDLRTGEAVVGARGLPLPRSGNFADVYQIRGADGRDWAVKCFTRPVTGLGDRYAAISQSLARAGLPFSVSFTYLEEGIRIDGKWWPVVKMEWVEGLLLNQVIRENAGRPAILSAFGQMWVKLCRRLRDCKVAHADLQHGNVLMVPGSRPGAYGLKLIDYDGMHVPALVNHPSGETGHPAYQHPGRVGKNGYCPDMDRFPHLLIATALKGLEVVGAPLWDRYDTGDNLLFTESDITNPAASKLLKELWQTQHAGVQALVGRLAIASQRPITQTPWLDLISPDGEPVPLDVETRREAIGTLGLPTSIPAALPPEPALEPVQWGDIVEKPPANVPTPIPTSEEAVKTVSTVKSTPGVAKKTGSNPSEASHIRREAKRESIEEEEPKKISTKLLLAIGSVAVLIGGVGAVVAFVGSKTKPQAAEIKSDEPTDPATPASNPAKQKNPPKDDSTSESVTPKPKDKAAEAATLKPKDLSTHPSVPVEAAPPFSTPDPILVTIKELRRIPVGNGLLSPAEFNRDGQRLILLGQPQRLKSYDVRSDETINLPDLPEGKGNTQHSVLDNRVAIWRQGQTVISLADINTGQPAGTIPFPDLPQPQFVNQEAIISISPNARYVAAGRRNPQRTYPGKAEVDYLPVPFRLLDTATGKVVLSFNWLNGLAQFTRDSARVLVVEGSGHGRWFKLPSGEPDGEWQFEEQLARMTLMDVKSISHDGQRLLCFGTARGQAKTYFLLDGLTGKVASVLGTGFNALSKAHLSGDGRIAVLNRQTQSPQETWLFVFDAARGVEAARIKVANIAGVSPSIALSPDGRRVAVGFAIPNKENIFYDLLTRVVPAEVVVKPKDPPPPSEPLVLKPRWSTVVPKLNAFRAYSEPGSNVLVLGSDEGVVALDIATGAPLKEFSAITAGKSHELFPLDSGRFGTVTSKRDDIEIWDAKNGKLIERVTVPSIPPGPANAVGQFVALSRNKKYVASGRAGPPNLDYPDLPFKIVESATRKVLVPEPWRGGLVHFTADGSRVLIAEWIGRCRWFRLPSGEQEDDGWDFSSPFDERIHDVHAISADGSSVAYRGPGIKKSGSQLGILEGKTGRVIRSFTKDYHEGALIALSENGRRAALLRAFTPGDNSFVRALDIIDVATGSVFYRARIEPGTAIPTFDFTPDGKGLVVQDPASHRAYFFEIDP